MSWNEKGLNHARAARRRQRTRELPILLSALLSSASIAALVLIPQQAQAQTDTWQGTTGVYNTAGNWNTGVAPVIPGQNAIFGASGSTAISITSVVVPDSWTFNSNSQSYVVTGSPVAFGTTGLTDNSSANISIANSLGGAGSVIQSGTGTLTLTGANTYTRNTAILSGTLKLSGSGTLGAASNFLDVEGGTLDLGTTTQTVNGELGLAGGTIQNGALSSSNGFGLVNGTVSAVLAGSGSVGVNGGASTTVTLSGVNTYTGGTTINRGTLQISGPGTLGNTGNSLLVTGGTLDLGGTTQTQNGGVEIDGGTVQNGTLSSSGGFNSYVAANTTGTVSAVLVGTGGLTIQPGSPGSNVGTLILTGNNTYSGGTTISAGTLQVGNGGTTGTLGSGAVTDNGTLAFNRSDTITVSNAISGTGGLTQAGSGTLILNGANSFTGTTTVTSGSLQIGDASHPGTTVAGNVSVGSGATLGGHGTVGGAVTNSGGTVMPGGSIGTLTVGSFSQNASGTLALEVSPAQASELKVTGAASLAGALVLTPDAGTYSIGQTYTLVDAAGGISGTFSSLNLGSYGSAITPQLSYGPNDVFLTLAKSFTPFVPLATSANQLAAANALMAAGSSSTLFNSVEALTVANSASVPGALGQLAGDIRPSLRAAAIEDSRTVRDALLDHMDHGGDGISLWGMGLAGYGGIASDGNAASLHHVSAGFLAGADMPVLSAVTLGVEAGYTVNSAHTPASLSTASGNSGHVGAYAVWSPGDVQLDIGGDYGFGSVTINRAIPQLGLATTASQDQQTGQVFADLGYRFTLERVQLEPHAQIAHVTATGGAFAETGNAAALTGNEKSDSATYSLLDLRANTADFALGHEMTLSPRLDLGWQHVLSVLTPYQTVSFANSGTSFLVLGTPLAHDAAAVQAGFDFKLGHSLMLSMSYDGSFSSTVENHAFRGGLSWRY
jgi:outer membrane autotransporter protein